MVTPYYITTVTPGWLAQDGKDFNQQNVLFLSIEIQQTVKNKWTPLVAWLLFGDDVEDQDQEKESYLVIKVISWRKLSCDKSYLVMKVICDKS